MSDDGAYWLAKGDQSQAALGDSEDEANTMLAAVDVLRKALMEKGVDETLTGQTIAALVTGLLVARAAEAPR